MGVPITALADLGKAMMKAGVEQVSYDALNEAIGRLSPLFAPGYDGTHPACAPSESICGVPATLVAAAFGVLDDHGVKRLHGDDVRALLAALAVLYHSAPPGSQVSA